MTALLDGLLGLAIVGGVAGASVLLSSLILRHDEVGQR